MHKPKKGCNGLTTSAFLKVFGPMSKTYLEAGNMNEGKTPCVAQGRHRVNDALFSAVSLADITRIGLVSDRINSG